MKSLAEQLKAWESVDRPADCTAKNGDTWTGEVELEGGVLRFTYRDANGDLYEMREEPALRLDLRTCQYRCIRESEAAKGLTP